MVENKPGENPNLNDMYLQLRYLQNIYARQFEMLENEIATYTLTVGAVQRNMQVFDNIKKVESSKMLVSGEGGTYIEAEIKKVSKALTYVGAGYLVEKTLEGAKAFLKDNEKKQQDALKKLVAEKEKIEKELIGINYKLAAMEQQ